MLFSANLGFLWADLPLPDAVRAAAAAGFAAVECHWPYETPPKALRAALDETGLPMLGLNTAPGDLAAGEFGLSALPGRASDAQAAIDAALDYAAATGTRAVHVMAGKAEGTSAQAAFVASLHRACTRAAPHGITILIEPLNTRDVPGYFLTGTAQAAEIFSDLGHANLKLMLDCYHMQIMEGDIVTRLAALRPILGHVQIASVPDRGPPGGGMLAYGPVLAELSRLGWTRPIGAEYRPTGPTADSLGWMETLGPAG